MFKYNFHDFKGPGALPADVNEGAEEAARPYAIPGLQEALLEFRKQKWYGTLTAYGLSPDQGAIPVFSCDFQNGVISQHQNLHVIGTPLKFGSYRILFSQNIKSRTVYMKKPKEQP